MTGMKTVDWQTLLEEITAHASHETLSKITGAPSLKNKIELCYKTPSIHSALKEWLSDCLSRATCHKSGELSVKYRETGNTYCKKKKHLSALKFYNKALFYAPKDSEELRSAYSNRSFVLFHLHRYQESIQDVDRALDTEGFSERNANLLLRKVHCLLALHKNSAARNVLNELTSVMSSLPDNSRKKISQTLKDINKNQNPPDDPQEDGSKDLNYPDIHFNENPDFPFASRSICLARNEKKGRFVKANEEIEVGDVLFAEKPFSFVVLPEMVDKYCSYCCKRTFAPVPCGGCPLLSFCSESCRETAYPQFHRWECDGGLELCYSIGIVHLALRVALSGSSQEMTARQRYSEVAALLSHLTELQSADLFSYTVTATLLTIYLENYTDMFHKEASSDGLFEFGGRILLHIGQLVCNGHAITDLQSEESHNSILVEDQVRVATAIYPSASMMNHACQPNIINSFFNSLLIVRATKALNKGDEVFNCYGPMVHNTDFPKRQELLLSQYFFSCDCDACLRGEGPSFQQYLCTTCSHNIEISLSECPNCLSPIDRDKYLADLNEADLNFKEGVKKLDVGLFHEAMPLLLKALKICESVCSVKHRKLLDCRDSLAKASAMQGNEEEAFSYLERNIKAIKGIYGEISIELGQEIMKLLSIATSLRDRNETLSSKQRSILKKSIEYGKRGLLIFKLSYGDWHPRYREMETHLNYLKTFSCSPGLTEGRR